MSVLYCQDSWRAFESSSIHASATEQRAAWAESSQGAQNRPQSRWHRGHCDRLDATVCNRVCVKDTENGRLVCLYFVTSLGHLGSIVCDFCTISKEA